MTARTASQQRAAQQLAALCLVFIAAAVVLAVLAARGDLTW